MKTVRKHNIAVLPLLAIAFFIVLFGAKRADASMYHYFKEPASGSTFKLGEEVPVSFYSGVVITKTTYKGGTATTTYEQMTAKLKILKGDTLLDEQSFNYYQGTTFETTYIPSVSGEITLELYGANLGLSKTELTLQDTLKINVKKPLPSEIQTVKPIAKVVRTAKTKAKIECVNHGDCGMEVYRSTSKTGKYTLIKKAASTIYTDAKLSASKAYYYKIRLYAKDGSKVYYSKYSAPVKAEKFGAPMITLSFYNNKAVKVTWKAMQGADYYVIARNDDGGVSYSVVSQPKAPATTFYDKKIESGKTYYYLIAGFTAADDNVGKYYGDQYKIKIP